jgi:hypothetical protein
MIIEIEIAIIAVNKRAMISFCPIVPLWLYNKNAANTSPLIIEKMIRAIRFVVIESY